MKKKTMLFLFCKLLICCYPVYATEDPLHQKSLYPVQVKSAPSHAPLLMVENGKANFILVRDYKREIGKPRLAQSTYFAAQRLVEAFHKCTGATIPEADIQESEKIAQYRYKILLGSGVGEKKLGLDPLKLPKGGFEVKTFADGMAICGYDSVNIPGFHENFPGDDVVINGTLHGAVDFIERFLNCRFYFPGELGEIFPKTKDVLLQAMDYCDWPRSYYRYPWNIHVSFNKERKAFWEPLIGPYDDSLRFAQFWRQAVETNYIAIHSPLIKNWVKLHPDKKDVICFTSPGGHLYYTGEAASGGNFVNVVSLELAELLVQDAKNYFESNGKNRAPWGWDHPNREYLTFGQMDSNAPVSEIRNTPIVKKMGLVTDAHIKRGRAGMLSDVYARFYNHICMQLKKELPGMRLGVMAYSDYTLPPLLPENQHLADNLDLRVCLMDLPGLVHNPKSIHHNREILRGWRKATQNRKIPSLWLYEVNGSSFLRGVCARFIGEVYKTYGEDITGEDLIYCYWNSLDWYYYYSIYPGMRALWNPEVDVDAIVEESWPLLYGEYATKVKEFHDLVVECYLKYYMTKKQTVYPPKVLDRLDIILNSLNPAMEGDAPIARRLRFFFQPWPKDIAAMRSQASYVKPTYRANRIANQQPTEADWDKAQSIPFLEPYGNPEEPKFRTDARLLWNTNGIYGRVRCDGVPGEKPNGDIFRRCNIEFILSPGLKQENVFQFVMASTGEIFTGKQEWQPIAQAYDASWKCDGFTSKVTQKNDKGWTLEFFVPYSGFYTEAPTTYDSWLFNIVRNKFSEPKEYTSSSMTNGSNRAMKLFGYLKFRGVKK